MRPLFALVVAMLLLGAYAAPAQAQEHTSYLFLRVTDQGPVVIDRFVGADAQGIEFPEGGSIDEVCMSFHNTDPRPATAVQLQLIFFDGGGTRTGSQVLERTGTFSTSARIDPINDHRMRPDDCSRIRVPRDESSMIAYYIGRVDFADGTSWKAAGLVFPDRVVPGTLWPDLPAPKTLDASAALVPVVTRTAATCESAAVPSIPAVQSVRVVAQPGPAIGDGLFRIGDVATCAGAAAGPGDAAALAAVKSYPAAVVGPQTFQVEVPALNVSPACTAPARLLSRQLFNGRDEATFNRLAPPGDYVGNMHVTVRADGYPTDAKLTHSTGRPEYDFALKYSAMESRYWPALTNGSPVTGDFNFAMKWSIVPATGGFSVRVYGAAMTPLPASCRPAA